MLIPNLTIYHSFKIIQMGIQTVYFLLTGGCYSKCHGTKFGPKPGRGFKSSSQKGRIFYTGGSEQKQGVRRCRRRRHCCVHWLAIEMQKCLSHHTSEQKAWIQIGMYVFSLKNTKHLCPKLFILILWYSCLVPIYTGKIISI